jgi:hypothetical protein
MTRKLFEDSKNRALLSFTSMFEALSPEYRISLVLRALRARDHVSADAGRSLDSAIRGSIRLVGYSNPALAISSALLEPVNESVVMSEKLATATLRVWAESLDELEKLVSGHLASQGLPTEYPDFENSRFRGFWDEEVWQRELDWIVDLAELWSEVDVALMLCYVSGRTIVLDEEPPGDAETNDGVVEISSLREKQEAGEETGEEIEPYYLPPEAPRFADPPGNAPQLEPAQAPTAGPVPPPRVSAIVRQIEGPAILNQTIEFLASLSPEDRNWNEAVPSFVDAVSGIRTLKSAQRERRASLLEAHTEIVEEFSADLEFLEQDTTFWTAQALTELSELDRTLELASGLKNLLTEYREVRRPGTTLTEELGRRERRFALEPRIIDIMGLMRQAMTEVRGSKRSPDEGEESGGDNQDPPGLAASPRRNSIRTAPRSNGAQRELPYNSPDNEVIREPGDN